MCVDNVLHMPYGLDIGVRAQDFQYNSSVAKPINYTGPQISKITMINFLALDLPLKLVLVNNKLAENFAVRAIGMRGSRELEKSLMA